MIEHLAKTIQWAERNTATFQEFDFHDGFYPHEIDNLNRLLHIIQAENQAVPDNIVARYDFYLYVEQHDIRNSSNFLATFPEFTEFYNRCKNEYAASQAAKALQT
jgi:hypothetical protein